MVKTHSETDILIIGGGVPGLALAALLGQAGLLVTLAEKYPPSGEIKPDGRTAALMQGSVNILKATGAWEKAEQYSEPLNILRIIDDSREQPVQVDFEAREIRLSSFGYNMPNNALRAVLYNIVRSLKNVTILHASLNDFTADRFGIKAVFDDANSVSASLIVGADGRQSVTRQKAGIKIWERDYGQQAMTCLIDHTKGHDNISTEFHRPSGPFTLVPMPGKQSSVVWVDYNEQAETFIKMSKHAFERALQDRSKDILGKVTLASTPQSWPLRALRAKSLTAPRTALVAEAAHVLHPMGAQGLNLSLRDVAALAEVVVDAMRCGQDPGSAAVLTQYERRRKHDVSSRVIGTDGLNRIVSNHYGLASGLRKIGLKTLDGITPLKEFAMHQGLAPQAEGRLASGEKL